MNTLSLSTQVIGSCESAPNSIRRVEWDNFHPVLMPDDESHQLAACKGEAGLRLTIAQAGRRGLLGRMALGGQTKTLAAGWILLLAASAATASPSREWAGLPESKVAEIANAIYRIEGGDKARVPYGILSVKVKSREDARRICCNTVRNNYVRWQKAGAKGDYRLYLADVYCPKSSDQKGNKNWRNNIVKMVNL